MKNYFYTNNKAMFKHSLSIKKNQKKEKQLKDSLDISVKGLTKSIIHFSEYYLQYNLLVFLPFVPILHFRLLYTPLQRRKTPIVLVDFSPKRLKTQKCL